MKQDHIFVAIRTSGTDPERDRIVEYTAIRTDRTGIVLKAFSEKRAQDEASNEYSESIIRGTLANLLDLRYDSKYVVVSHVVETTRTFIKAECQRINSPFPFGNRRWIDLSSLAWPLAFNDMITSFTLDTLMRHHGIIPERAEEHELASAEYNAAMTMTVYWEMMRRMTSALKAEEYLRKKGGDTLENIRRVFRV